MHGYFYTNCLNDSLFFKVKIFNGVDVYTTKMNWRI